MALSSVTECIDFLCGWLFRNINAAAGSAKNYLSYILLSKALFQSFYLDNFFSRNTNNNKKQKKNNTTMIIIITLVVLLLITNNNKGLCGVVNYE